MDDDDYPFDDEEFDDEPIGSCDNCDCDIYEDTVCYFHGDRLCDHCAWLATDGNSQLLDD